MDQQQARNSIGMTRGSLLRIEDGPGLTVRVWHGEVWITQEGDRRDYLLKTGESMRLDRGGAALGYATHRSIVTLVAPACEPYARRVLLYRAGCALPLTLYDAVGTQPGIGRRLGYALRRLWPAAFALPARPAAPAFR